MDLFDEERGAEEHADADVESPAGDESCDAANLELNELAGHLNVVNARLVARVEQLLESGEWEQGGKRTPAAFVAWKLGLSPERANVVVRVAERRSEFPVVIGAFDRGELSLEQVAEAVKAPAWADAEIAHFCHIATPAKIRRAMRSNMFEGDPDEPEPEPKPPKDRLSFGIGRNGRWKINGELGVDDGRLIEEALAERKDAMFTAGDEDVTWAEAFVSCFTRSLGSVESVSRRDHYRTWIHFDVTAGTVTTTDGWHIPSEIARRLLCDGVVQPVWEEDGVPFSVGKSQRIVPDRTRRIVERRDRGCRVPGCTADRFVEIHHIIHWTDDDGPTDTWNLICLCPRHHKMHHAGELGISGNADEFDGVTFTDANGDRIPGVGKPAPPNQPPPSPAAPYEPPLNGRFDWNWIGLGWIHPNAMEKRRKQLDEHFARQTGEAEAA